MKSILFIHIGGGVPEYLQTNLEVFRRNNPFNPVFVYCAGQAPEFLKQLGCFVIAPYHILKTDSEKFTNFYGQVKDHFRYRTLARLFLISDITDVFDIDLYAENDVMIFDSIDKVQFDKTFVQVTSDAHATPSVMGIEKESYSALCEFILQNYNENEDDMTLLNKAVAAGIINSSNILPDGEKIIFDGASYGQYLGGTHESGPGWAEDAHYVGKAIINKEIDPYFDNDIKKPFVKKDGVSYPLFNLHVHSKKLNLFA